MICQLRLRTANGCLQPRQSVKMMGTWLVIVSVFLSQLLIYTWCRVQCVQIGYEISRETDTYHHLLSLQNTFKIEIERLRSPDRIARIADSQLDLITPPPQSRQILVVYETH